MSLMIRIYDYPLSGNCYKVRLLISMLELPYDSIEIDFYPGQQHRSADFLEINPLGQLPVLEDGDLILRDSHAIMVYLASRYDKADRWYPLNDPSLLGEITQWFAFSDGLTSTSSAARLHDGFSYDFDVEDCRAGAHRLMRVLDEHLWFREQEGLRYICSAGHATLADLACFPYIALSEEGGIYRRDYPAIRRWLDRVKVLPGFVVMPGVFPASLHESPEEIFE